MTKLNPDVTRKMNESTPSESIVSIKANTPIPIDSDVTLKSDGSIPIDAGITIHTDGSIPIEMVKAAYGWQEIILNNLPFLITILIVATAATVNYFSNRKSVESQNEIATKARNEEHENKISEFRHQWINEVRKTVSLLCQILHELQFNIAQRNIARTNIQDAFMKSDEESSAKFEADAIKSYNKLIEKRSEYYKVSTKLKLLFKKDDSSTALAFEIINDINKEVYDFDKMDLDESKIDRIVSIFQEVLKEEWEVTKARTWQKNT